MKVLLLGPSPSPLRHILLKHGACALMEIAAPVDLEQLGTDLPDFAISCGYRHILKAPVIETLSGRLINLHISLLPWNRGADPNFWSFYDDTPQGVSIHHIDTGIDTGGLLAQRELRLDAEAETLASAYERLQQAMAALFAETWPLVVQGRATATPQPSGGSFHRKRDLEPHLPLLRDKGWNTPAITIFRAGAQARGGV